MNIDIKKVSELRQLMNAGLQDCRNALIEAEGDIQKAVDILRRKGSAVASKKAGRDTREGAVGFVVNSEGTHGVVIELNTETDFVALNDKFLDLVNNILIVALQTKNLEELKQAKLPSGLTVEEEIREHILKFGENLNLSRVSYLTVQHGIVAAHAHRLLNSAYPNIGKIAVLVGIEADSSTEAVKKFGHNIAAHIVGMDPIVLNKEQLPQELVDKQRQILTEQAEAAGTKTEAILHKRVEGGLNKYYQEAVLLEQSFLFDTNKKVRDALIEFSQNSGTNTNISGFVRYQLGQG